MTQAFSLMGPFNSRPYAIGERPGGSYIPTIPLLSGQAGWDSLTPYYTPSALDSSIAHFARGVRRATDHPATKKAGLGGLIKAPSGGMSRLPQGLAKVGPRIGIDPSVAERLFPKIDLSKSIPTDGSFWQRAREAVGKRPGAAALAGGAGVAGLGTAAHMAGANRPMGARAAEIESPHPPEPTLSQRAAAGDISPPEPSAADRARAGETSPAFDAVKNRLQAFVGSASEPGQLSQFAGKYWPALAAGGAGVAGLMYLFNKRREEKRRQAALRSLPFVIKSAEDAMAFAVAHPLVAGFLRRCGEANLSERQIHDKIAIACKLDPTVKEAFEKIGLVDGFTLSQHPPQPQPQPQPQPPPAAGEAAPPPKLVGSPKAPDQPFKGPSLYGHYADQAFNPQHDWNQDPTDAPGDALLRTGARAGAVVGVGAGAAAGGAALAPGAAAAIAPSIGTGISGGLMADALTGSHATGGAREAITSSLAGNRNESAQSPDPELDMERLTADYGVKSPEAPPVPGPDGKPATTPGQMQEAMTAATQSVQSQPPEKVDAAKEMLTSGTVPDAVKKEIAPTLMEQLGIGLQQAWAHVQKMPIEHQIAMWLGLGLGTVSLIHSMTSEEGGIGSWLATLLGLGTAAGVAAHGGVFGQQAQQAMHGAEGSVANAAGNVAGAAGEAGNRVGDWIQKQFNGGAAKPTAGGAAKPAAGGAAKPAAPEAKFPWLKPFIAGGDGPGLDAGDSDALVAAAKSGQITPEQIREFRGSLGMAQRVMFDVELRRNGIRI
jgi:hypothetical protein